MVGTRKSGSAIDLETNIHTNTTAVAFPEPSATPPAADTPNNANPAAKRRLNNALKKLQIDALPALQGEAVPAHAATEEASGGETYHWRGSSYAVTDSTPKEWLDQEPSRYKKRKSGGGSGAETEPERKRQRLVKEKEKKLPEPKPKVPKLGRKQARESSVEEQKEEREVVEKEVEDDAEARPAKRPRRHSENYNVNYSRPKDLSDFTPGRKKARNSGGRGKPASGAGHDRMRSSRLLDYTRVGGHDTLSCIEHARRRAARMGYVVRPIPKKRMEHSKVLQATVGRDLLKLAQLNSEIDRLVDEVTRAEDVLDGFMRRIARGRSNSRNVIGDAVTTNGDTNYADDAGSPTHYSPGPEAQLVSPIATNNHDPFPDPTHSSRSTQDLPRSSYLHTTSGDPAGSDSEPKPTTENHEPAIAERTERHDSGASLTTVADAAVATAITTASVAGHPNYGNKLSKRAAQSPSPRDDDDEHLPTTNRGGQPLRWSLPKRLQEEGRAEEAINRGRLTGESRSARRRRVKRELKLVKSWEEVTPAGEDEEGESGGGKRDEKGEADGAGKEDLVVEAEVDEPGVEDETEDNLGHIEDHEGTGNEESHSLPASEGEESSSEEDGAATPVERRSSRVEKSKTTVCRDWKNGVCHRGDRCTYKHEA